MGHNLTVSSLRLSRVSQTRTGTGMSVVIRRTIAKLENGADLQLLKYPGDGARSYDNAAL